MTTLAKKRNFDSFFTPTSQKKARLTEEKEEEEERNAKSPPDSSSELSHHADYPFPIPHLPPRISDQLSKLPATDGQIINNQPDLDLVYFKPFVPKSIERDLFEFLRRELFFYRVHYSIKRGPTETKVTTPRYTTVFGVDSTSLFNSSGTLCDAKSQSPIPASSSRYRCTPRPIPHCLTALLTSIEAATSAHYNFCLVNYYASGADSISYHSDDERFLGPNPTIASLSLGAPRDFLMKHKPPVSVPASASAPSSSAPSAPPPPKNPLKFPLAGGDMVLMRGRTQACWLHSIPKRKDGGGSGGGRINITFRKAVERAGTENYYRYNVGEGECWRWDEGVGGMREVRGLGERGG